MDGSSTLSLIVAVVAALSSLIVAGVSYLSTRKNTHDLEALKADLTVDPPINHQYVLAKWLYLSFTEDFALAVVDPLLEYDPNHEQWLEKREKSPQTYWRQGVFTGTLDNAVEALLIHDPNGVVRCMSFGEFEAAYQTTHEHHKFDAFIDLFRNFHPKIRPVLWRVLVTQAHIYEALFRTRERKLTDSGNVSPSKLIKLLSEKERLDFDWRQSRDEASDDEVLRQPFDAAYAYLREHIGEQLVE